MRRLARAVMLRPLLTTTDVRRADCSPWLWGAMPDGGYRLTLLGIVNTPLARLGVKWRVSL